MIKPMINNSVDTPINKNVKENTTRFNTTSINSNVTAKILNTLVII